MQVRIVADSVNKLTGKRITTFELEYPRFIHAEVMTHRMFSRNGQSSRAVPLNKNLSHPPVYPSMYGVNRSGMSSSEELPRFKKAMCKALWGMSAYVVRLSSQIMAKIGLHKQWVNRPLEWQQNIKVVVTSTEWDNFFNLRLESKTVQPEMVELARMMKTEMDYSLPETLNQGEWHLPYMVPLRSRYNDNVLKYVDPAGEAHDLDSAKLISISACAQVSYRNLDTGLAKAINIVKRLSDRDDPHLSPFEHQATPMLEMEDFTLYPWQEGVTHMDRDHNLWSGNFQGWIQNRQLMEV